MAEYWDLYDENRQPLGKTILRGSMKPMSGSYHVAVMIVTMNSHGKLLCTLRSKDKETYPGLWEFTAGSVLAGEDSFTAAGRELFEETGISAEKGEFKLIKTVREAAAFIDCFFLRRDTDISEIKLQKGETEGAKWVSKAELENMIAQKKVAFPVERRYSQLYSFLMEEGFI